jgi:hypothetical protein
MSGAALNGAYLTLGPDLAGPLLESGTMCVVMAPLPNGALAIAPGDVPHPLRFNPRKVDGLAKLRSAKGDRAIALYELLEGRVPEATGAPCDATWNDELRLVEVHHPALAAVLAERARELPC